MKKAYLIEKALQHHLQALREIPEDLIIPSRLVLTGETMAETAERIAGDDQPSARSPQRSERGIECGGDGWN